MQAAWGPVRVLVAASQEHGPEVIKPLYDSIGARLHTRPLARQGPRARRGRRTDFTDILTEALAEVSLPAKLAKAATLKKYDAAVRRSHKRAISLVGTDVGTPVVAVGGAAFFGPIVSPVPRGGDAGRLWDGYVLVAGTPGVFEIKRTRTVGPLLD